MPAPANCRSTRNTAEGLQGCYQGQDEWFKSLEQSDWQVTPLSPLAKRSKPIREIARKQLPNHEPRNLKP